MIDILSYLLGFATAGFIWIAVEGIKSHDTKSTSNESEEKMEGIKCKNGCNPMKLFEIGNNQFSCKECNEVFTVSTVSDVQGGKE